VAAPAAPYFTLNAATRTLSLNNSPASATGTFYFLIKGALTNHPTQSLIYGITVTVTACVTTGITKSSNWGYSTQWYNLWQHTQHGILNFYNIMPTYTQTPASCNAEYSAVTYYDNSLTVPTWIQPRMVLKQNC